METGVEKNEPWTPASRYPDPAVQVLDPSFAPYHLKRLVLLTDANENSGRMMNELPRLKDNRIRVYTMPMGVRWGCSNGERWPRARGGGPGIFVGSGADWIA